MISRHLFDELEADYLMSGLGHGVESRDKMKARVNCRELQVGQRAISMMRSTIIDKTGR